MHEVKVRFSVYLMESDSSAKHWYSLSFLKNNSIISWSFSSGSVVKNPPADAGDVGSIPGSRRSLGKGSGNPLQYSCLGNPMDREAWQATVYGVIEESETTYQLNNNNNHLLVGLELKRKCRSHSCQLCMTQS